MDTRRLLLLEQAIEPYQRAGFVVTSQSEGAITLAVPPEKFSYAFFIFTLLFLWPVAVVYLVSFNNQRGKSVCLRITSQGHVEVSGYTFEVLARERKRRRAVFVLLSSILVAVILFIVIRLT
jgi:predicted nucleic acid-binding Zn ribbon protein